MQQSVFPIKCFMYLFLNNNQLSVLELQYLVDPGLKAETLIYPHSLKDEL